MREPKVLGDHAKPGSAGKPVGWTGAPQQLKPVAEQPPVAASAYAPSLALPARPATAGGPSSAPRPVDTSSAGQGLGLAIRAASRPSVDVSAPAAAATATAVTARVAWEGPPRPPTSPLRTILLPRERGDLAPAAPAASGGAPPVASVRSDARAAVEAAQAAAANYPHPRHHRPTLSTPAADASSRSPGPPDVVPISAPAVPASSTAATPPDHNTASTLASPRASGLTTARALPRAIGGHAAANAPFCTPLPSPAGPKSPLPTRTPLRFSGSPHLDGPLPGAASGSSPGVAARAPPPWQTDTGGHPGPSPTAGPSSAAASSLQVLRVPELGPVAAFAMPSAPLDPASSMSALALVAARPGAAMSLAARALPRGPLVAPSGLPAVSGPLRARSPHPPAAAAAATSTSAQGPACAAAARSSPTWRPPDPSEAGTHKAGAAIGSPTAERPPEEPFPCHGALGLQSSKCDGKADFVIIYPDCRLPLHHECAAQTCRHETRRSALCNECTLTLTERTREQGLPSRLAYEPLDPADPSSRESASIAAEWYGGHYRQGHSPANPAGPSSALNPTALPARDPPLHVAHHGAPSAAAPGTAERNAPPAAAAPGSAERNAPPAAAAPGSAERNAPPAAAAAGPAERDPSAAAAGVAALSCRGAAGEQSADCSGAPDYWLSYRECPLPLERDCAAALCPHPRERTPLCNACTLALVDRTEARGLPASFLYQPLYPSDPDSCEAAKIAAAWYHGLYDPTNVVAFGPSHAGISAGPQATASASGSATVAASSGQHAADAAMTMAAAAAAAAAQAATVAAVEAAAKLAQSATPASSVKREDFHLGAAAAAAMEGQLPPPPRSGAAGGDAGADLTAAAQVDYPTFCSRRLPHRATYCIQLAFPCSRHDVVKTITPVCMVVAFARPGEDILSEHSPAAWKIWFNVMVSAPGEFSVVRRKDNAEVPFAPADRLALFARPPGQAWAATSAPRPEPQQSGSARAAPEAPAAPATATGAAAARGPAGPDAVGFRRPHAPPRQVARSPFAAPGALLPAPPTPTPTPTPSHGAAAGAAGAADRKGDAPKGALNPGGPAPPSSQSGKALGAFFDARDAGASVEEATRIADSIFAAGTAAAGEPAPAADAAAARTPTIAAGAHKAGGAAKSKKRKAPPAPDAAASARVAGAGVGPPSAAHPGYWQGVRFPFLAEAGAHRRALTAENLAPLLSPGRITPFPTHELAIHAEHWALPFGTESVILRPSTHTFDGQPSGFGVPKPSRARGEGKPKPAPAGPAPAMAFVQKGQGQKRNSKMSYVKVKQGLVIAFPHGHDAEPVLVQDLGLVYDLLVTFEAGSDMPMRIRSGFTGGDLEPQVAFFCQQIDDGQIKRGRPIRFPAHLCQRHFWAQFPPPPILPFLEPKLLRPPVLYVQPPPAHPAQASPFPSATKSKPKSKRKRPSPAASTPDAL
jgi:hypothetical protein